jgi:hypothetical protein
VAQQRVAVARREADPELLGGRLVEAPLTEELPRRQRLRGAERVGVELLGDLVRLDQAGPLRTPGALRSGVTFLAAQRDPGLVGEPLDRLGEAEAVDLLQDGDDVAALRAPEAVEELALRVDVERRGLLVVEGAQALQRAAPGGPEGDVVGDDLVDADLLTHLRDVFLANTSGHARSLRRGADGSGGIPPDLWGTACA